MKANDTPIDRFLQGSKQFIVPLFQRPYSWKKENIEKLWKDLEDTMADDDYIHFFGSFVTMPVPTGPGIPDKYIVVDGQQRLTTIFILLAALRSNISKINPDYLNMDEINELYLINKFHREYKLKLLPTQADKETFSTLIEEINPQLNSNHLLTDAYKFFNDKFAEIETLEDLLH